MVDSAITTYMQMFGVDRETASYWISSAMGGGGAYDAAGNTTTLL
jgi:hypothetical protein